MASIAGYALLRPATNTGEWVSQPGLSLPAAVGPSIAGSDTENAAPTQGQPGDFAGGTDGDSGSSTVTRTNSPKPAAGGGTASQSVAASPAVSGSPASSVTSGPPISLLPSAIPTGQGMLANGSGLCLDLRGGRAAEGRDVHVDTCNGTSPQRWKLNSDRTLEVLNMCAYLVGDGTAELTRCDGRTTAQWQLFANGTLINMSNGLCLTDPNSGTRTSTAVTVTVCTGSKNQSWTFT
ncbi:RICIN domain-containing protein [Actinoplanes derwentensis]|uniref:RICIN domain-containing protein n=1 Tax=Actinoplanes derwentensis TaxID=113562 RepID=UPI0012FD2663|nr:RICIN domain-containing protein [Actinoplanes derwentensis]